jgi:acid stress-induced BolA-like protein IbaG/YrbA
MKIPKTQSDGIAWLKSRGVESDLRQENWPICFAVFPSGDSDTISALSDITSALKEFYIEHAIAIAFSSRVRQITFTPIVSSLGPEALSDRKISYRSSEDAAHIFVNLAPAEWRGARKLKRRKLVQVSLLAAISEVRKSWLNESDRMQLLKLFGAFC